MITAFQKNTYRWVLLTHVGALNDLKGIHYDLLLEDKIFCRSWRLSEIPLLDGPYVEAIHISPHKLAWLEISEKVLSKNRGVVTQIKKGIFLKSLPSIETSFINIELQWEKVEVHLVIDQNGCRILSKN